MERQHSFALQESRERKAILQSQTLCDGDSRSDRPFCQADRFDDGAGERRQGGTQAQNRGQRLREHETGSNRAVIMWRQPTGGNSGITEALKLF
jgi:hypothetical protein